ncbi:SAM-dependent methyltransferase [Acinetobacter larvae]|uniref:Methyltransferase n=1 Tax=Acinetobacter larvae TaxID=1789224 RepID=A0A1B2M3R9_9GAMM|nr:class I SAM-dependent methyltransferase [Acinetobacter larvae]AOA59819.1 hypothetical protein BFG52_01105 [Acinetobacter larvae]
MMVMRLLQQAAQHKFAIDTAYLGDDAVLAWSNLGYWHGSDLSYVQACQQLADRLAQALQLGPNDHVLDLGCGFGASLQHWQQHYAVQQISAVELQAACTQRIKQVLQHKVSVYQHSFLELAHLPIKADVVLSIDAAYHYDLNDFISAVKTVLAPQGRIGFHYLLRTAAWQNCSAWQRQQYRYLLKAAAVDLAHLPDAAQLRQCLQQHQLQHIEMQSCGREVLAGFANYAKQQAQMQKQSASSIWAQLKINMTAKLCHKLYTDGLIDYVQVTARAG